MRNEKPPKFDRSGRFPTTRWSRVDGAKSPENVEAINDLHSAYWKPVFYFVRAKGHPLHQAEDFTQAFFASFLEGDWLQSVDPNLGRFRTFMLTLLTRFLADEGPNRVTKQKSFERSIASVSSLLTQEDRDYEPAVDETPDELFARRWAAALVQLVREDVRRELDSEDRAVWYELFEANVSPDGSTGISKPRLAEQFGLSLDQVRHRVGQVKKRFDELFRNEIRQQVSSDVEIDEEINELFSLLAGE